MSERTLPLVFINLGGEMLYILDQRLRADDSTEKVLNDIVSTMFSKSFMDELIKPQQLYSHRTLKTVLTRLAHASIMRLNPASMDRLYELMVMAFKYQVFLCPRPKDLLLITYNHVDAVRDLVKDTPALVNQVDDSHRRIIEVYSSLSHGEFQLLRQTLLIFFQDSHVRVSLFLKSKVQNPNGRFALTTSGPVPQGTEVPGLIRMFDRKGRETRRREFPCGCGSYASAVREGSFLLHGERRSTLGTNMYRVLPPEETHTCKTPSVQKSDRPNLLAKEELNLLARLMGSVTDQNPADKPGTGFRINLFTTDEEEEQASESSGSAESAFGVISIQAMQDEQSTSELARISRQFSEQRQEASGSSVDSKGDDLLAMMDDL